MDAYRVGCSLQRVIHVRVCAEPPRLSVGEAGGEPCRRMECWSVDATAKVRARLFPRRRIARAGVGLARSWPCPPAATGTASAGSASEPAQSVLQAPWIDGASAVGAVDP